MQKACLLLILVALSGQVNAQQDVVYANEDDLIEGLMQTLRTAKTAKDSLDVLEEISRAHYNRDSTMKYATMERDLAQRLGAKALQASALRYMAWADYYNDNFLNCCEMTFEGISLCEEVGDTAGLASCYTMMANTFAAMKDETGAKSYFHKALELQLRLGNDYRVADLYRNLAHTAIDDHELTKAKEYIDKAMEHNMKHGDTISIADNYFYYGYLLYHKAKSNKDQTALRQSQENLQKSLDMAKRSDEILYVMRALHYIETNWIVALKWGCVQSVDAVLDSCRTAIAEEVVICEAMDFESEIIDANLTEVEFLTECKKLEEATEKLGIVEKRIRRQPNMSRHFSDFFEVKKNLHKARGETHLALISADSLTYWLRENEKNRNSEMSSQSSAQATYNRNIQQMEHAESERNLLFEAERRRQRTMSISLIIGMLLTGGLTVLVVRNSMKRHKVNRMLDETNSELEQQRADSQALNAELELQQRELAEQNKRIENINENIAASMRYAQLIQAAAFPTMSMLKETFGDCLVLFKSMSIVSGDFLWTARAGRFKMVAVVDCTGHGVPGAFMSMLGISTLNDIVAEINASSRQNDIAANEILNVLRTNLRAVLRRRDDTTRDGMDVALVVVDEERQLLQFAGARRPLTIVRDGIATKIDGDRMPIGAHTTQEDSFTEHVVSTQPGDTVYIFTDGVVDQFGYEADGRMKKYTAKRLRDQLATLAHLPFQEQMRRLVAIRAHWMSPKGNATQPATLTDDSLMFGFRIGNATTHVAPTKQEPDSDTLTDFIRQ